jgi:Homeodomain-like domain
MSVSSVRYPVKLPPGQRNVLEMMIHTSSTLTKHYLVARVLLMSDQSQGGPSHTDGHIAEALSISRRTVIRIKQRFVQENLEVARTLSFPREQPEQRCLDGKGEAQLIALACSQAASRATTLDTGTVGRPDGAPGLRGAYQPGDGENHTQKK